MLTCLPSRATAPTPSTIFCIIEWIYSVDTIFCGVLAVSWVEARRKLAGWQFKSALAPLIIMTKRGRLSSFRSIRPDLATPKPVGYDLAGHHTLRAVTQTRSRPVFFWQTIERKNAQRQKRGRTTIQCVSAVSPRQWVFLYAASGKIGTAKDALPVSTAIVLVA